MKSCRGTSDRDSLSRSQHPKPDAGVPLGSNHLATWNIAIRHFDIQSASQIFKKQLTPARRNEGIIQADRVRGRAVRFGTWVQGAARVPELPDLVRLELSGDPKTGLQIY